MDFFVIIILDIIFIIILGFIFNYNLKKIKALEKESELDEIAKSYPSNIELCKEYLKKLKNESVTIEENKNSEASLYIAVSNKISIANISNTYTRIQTIAHECLHSIQDRKILMFNFIFSNLYLIFYVLICILAIFKVLPNKMMFLNIFLTISMVYYMVRIYLENDAMTRAEYLAKEYINEKQNVKKEDIKKLEIGFENVTKIGIKCVNYTMFLNIMVKILIFSIICLLR